MEVPSIFLNRILAELAKRNGSDLHLSVGSPPMIRLNGQIAPLNDQEMMTADVLNKLAEVFLSPEEIIGLKEAKDMILVKTVANFRFRINVFFEKGLLGLSFHYIPGAIRPFAELGLPEACENFLLLNSGLVVIAGARNSGKTAAAAALLEGINKTAAKNIITIEDPIEYLFVSKKSLISQRQVGSDVKTAATGLDYCLSEDVNVVYINEIKDDKVLAAALPKIFELASGNCLVILEINADGSIRVLEKLLAGVSQAMPAEAARYNLADILAGVVTLKLVKRRGGGLISAAEVLLNNGAVKSLVREGKIYQLDNIIQTSRKEGMISLEKSLANLIEAGEVRREDI